MKPRTKFHKAVAASNERLAALSTKALEWALANVIEHIAFRTSGRKCTCGDCAHRFEHEGKGKHVRCPNCNRKLAIKDTLKRKGKAESYFSTIATIDGLQVQRVYLLSVSFRKGKEMRM